MIECGTRNSLSPTNFTNKIYRKHNIFTNIKSCPICLVIWVRQQFAISYYRVWSNEVLKTFQRTQSCSQHCLGTNQSWDGDIAMLTMDLTEKLETYKQSLCLRSELWVHVINWFRGILTLVLYNSTNKI